MPLPNVAKIGKTEWGIQSRGVPGVLHDPQKDYLSGLDFAAFAAETRARHPWLAEMLADWPEAETAAYVAEMNRLSWEFEGTDAGGRGIAYNEAQQNADNRAEGMATILGLFDPGGTVLDVLAGDGTVARFAGTLPAAPRIISADLSRLMIDRCRAQGLACLRQSATRSFLRDNSLDGVLIAWGSHHLDPDQRRAATAEAHRTLRPGGRYVLHDFETGGPVDAWFARVVHPFSRTGHPHLHFSRDEMHGLLQDTGFAEVEVREISDPFLLSGATHQDARRAMLRHLHAMYDLAKLPLVTEADHDRLEAEARATMGPITYADRAGGVRARLDRPALVATGRKG